MTPLERISQALRDRGYELKLSGRDHMCKCPAHDDRTPSLSIREEKPGGRIFVKCFAGCSDTDILERLGMTVKDLFPENGTEPQLSVRSGLKVEDLAAAKHMPVPFLKSLGVDTTWVRKSPGKKGQTVVQALVDPEAWESMEFKSQWREVIIPYRHRDGSHARARRRMKVSGTPKHCWAGTKSDGEIIAYGLDQLEKAREAGYIILVEGETDCWALWLHEFPALGVPGASVVNTLKRECFDGIDRVYLVQEPDAGGETFYDAVRSKLSSWKTWHGDLHVIRQPGGEKDVCDLRMRAPDAFKSTMEGILANADPVPLESKDTGKEKSQKPDKVKIEQAFVSGGLLPLTDMGNAERLIARHGVELRYCYEMDTWFVWTGTHWTDDYAAVERRAKETVRAIPNELLIVDDLPDLTDDERDVLKERIQTHALHSEARPRLFSMVELAKSESGVQVRAADLDANHWLFNVQNGTVDLRVGELRPHDPADLITLISPIIFNKDARAPLWESFLSDIMDNRAEMVDYLQRVIGYSMTGDVSEQCLFFLWGNGCNGKSTFTEIVQRLLGGLCHKSNTSLFTAGKNSADDGRPTPELSRLRGRRLVVTSELDIGKRVDEARIKDLTGSDTIVARGLYQDYIEFQPTHKLFVFGNHKPTVKGADIGIWRRLRLIPFTVCFDDFPEKKDLHLKHKLLDELPGILNWAIAGCQEWRTLGLGIPKCVEDATQEYRDDMDVLGAFLERYCIIDPAAKVAAGVLYNEYKLWAYKNNEPEPTSKAFGMMLRERGFTPTRTSVTRYWSGLSLLPKVEREKRDNEDTDEASDPTSFQGGGVGSSPEGSCGRHAPKSPVNPENMPQRDASVTQNDVNNNDPVIEQGVGNSELNHSSDSYDTFQENTLNNRGKKPSLSCTRDREHLSAEIGKVTESGVIRCHKSHSQISPDSAQWDPPLRQDADKAQTPPSGVPPQGRPPTAADQLSTCGIGALDDPEDERWELE